MDPERWVSDEAAGEKGQADVPGLEQRTSEGWKRRGERTACGGVGAGLRHLWSKRSHT